MQFRTDRRSLLTGSAGLAATSLGACANGRIVGLDRERRSLDIANQGEPLSLDPHKASGTWENNIIGNMLTGLTTEDQHARPSPGMAQRWETSADGLTWTFFLRPAVWSDGEPCDAHDFEFALRRILDPNTLAQYASILYPILNAEAVNAGEMAPDELGVAAIDDHTLEIRLKHPAPYLPQMLKHYTSFPVPKHKVEAFGTDWVKPENIVTNGAFVLKRWWSNYIVHLEKNPRFFDAANVQLEHLYFYPSVDVNAAARKIQSGEGGWSTRFPSNQVAELRRSLPGFVRVAPYLYIQYFSFNTTRAPFNDARVRQALAMSLDREFLATQIFRTGEAPAYSFVPPGTADYPSTARYPWADVSLDQRRQEAERLLRAAGFGPNNPLRFELSHRNTSDNPRVAVVAQNDWGRIAPWVTVELAGVETQIHYANLRAKNFQVGDGGWVADYNDAKTFLYLMETRTGPQNYSGYSNPAYDQLMLQSDNEPDAALRAQLMMQAEQLVLNDCPVCASVFMNSTNLVHPDLTGYEDNLDDIHRARYFGIRGL
ncbi:MAG: peptide ABC transporter substrate-binding protein [Hyphomonadaceae bacterium]